MKKSGGQDRGHEYERMVRDHFARTAIFPTAKDGALNVTALARGAGVPVQSIYKNPNIRALVAGEARTRGVPWNQERHVARSEEFRGDGASTADRSGATTLGLSESALKAIHAIKRTAHRLEQQNGALIAENADLRQQVVELRLQNGREDMMIETGRRIPRPDDAI